MSNRLESARADRRPTRLSPARELPQAQSEIAAYMLGIIAVFTTVIGFTYAAIGLWRVLS